MSPRKPGPGESSAPPGARPARPQAGKGAGKVRAPGAAAPDASPELRERLRRALFVIPYAVAHPGCTVEELAHAARLTPAQLLTEIDFLRMVGRPPFTPADLVDIDVEDGRVYVALPQGLSRPPSLTPLEAAALDAAASALAPVGGDALREVREKLRRALPPAARPQFDSVAGRVLVETGALEPEVARPIDRAIEESLELELTYWSAGRGEATRRILRPLERVLHQGYWYLHAYDCGRKDRRLFRLDRAAELSLTGRSFVPRPADDKARFLRETLYAPSEQARAAQVRISPGPWAEPAMARRLGATAVSGSRGGGCSATFVVDGEAYLVALLLSLEGAGELVEPQDLRERVRVAALAAARRHGP